MNRLALRILFLLVLLIAGFSPASVLAVAPTVVSTIPDTTVVEDNPPLANYRDLNSVFSDTEDGSALTFTIESNTNPALLNVVIDADSALDFSFIPDGAGAAQIIFRATDTEALFAEDTLTVTVTAVNDTPVVAIAMPDTTIDEDAVINAYRDLNQVFLDVEDAGTLAFTIESNTNPSLLNTVINGDSALNFTCAPNLSGSATLVVRATDIEGLFVEDTLDVVVLPVNDDPVVVAAIPDTLVLIDSAPIDNHVDLNDIFSDIEDGSNLTFTVHDNDVPGAVSVVIDPDSAVDISFTPDTHAMATIVIRATDSGGLFVDETFVVRVHRTFWVINADGTGHESTLRATINWSLDGDTLMLTDGTYTGSGNRGLSFDGKDIVITSENGPEVTIIDLEYADRAFTMNGVGPGAVLSDLTITHGSQTQGSCIKMSGGSPVLSGLVLTGNVAGIDGGAIYMDAGGSPTITGCRIIGNSAVEGGGIYANASTPLIENCTIIANSASSGGAGIHLRNSSDATITNSIIAFNTQGPGIECADGSNPTVSCSNVFGNEGGDAICGTDLGNNLSADPLFCGPPGSGDVYIEEYSPCAPAHNPCGTQIGALPVGCASGPDLIDAAGTVYPPATFADATGIVLHVGLDNMSAVGVMLDTTSTILFSDSTNVFSATLANQTYVPGNATNFTATFKPATVPAGMATPSTYDLRLSFTGIDDSSMAYADTFLTTGRNTILVDTPKIVISALPLDVQTVFPGRPNVSILMLDFQNGYGSDRYLDSLTVMNLSSGPGTPAQIDSEIERLYLVDDVDDDRTLSAPDTVISETIFNANRAVFDLAGSWNVPGSGGESLIVTADIDSLDARDPDRIDVAVIAPQDVVFQGSTEINQDFSPLYPLNSFGYVTIDGMASHQISFAPSITDTLYSGSTDTWLVTLIVPQNGYDADTLLSLSIADYAGDFSPNDLSALRIYRDNGNTVFDPASDTILGEMVYSGDRYEITGLSETVDAGTHFFIAADTDLGATNGHHFKPGIPIGGIEVTSSNDGPIDTPVVSSKTFAFKNTESIEITNIPFAAYTPRRGDTDATLLSIELKNNTLLPVTLDSLALMNMTRGRGSQDDFDNTFATIRIYHDNGNGIVDGGDTILADNLQFMGGSLIARTLNHPIAIGEVSRFFVTADIDSFCAADGDTISVAVSAANDIGINPVYPIAGVLPTATPVDLAIDGMRAYQLALYPSIDSLIVTGGNDILVLDTGIPANGYAIDTLETLFIRNAGTASTEHFARLALYTDGGDEMFDAGAGDDTYIGDMTENPAEPGGRSFMITGIDVPLDTSCGGRKHFYIAVDITPNYLVAGTIQMSIPAMGVGVRSDNDGPIDGNIVESSIIVIPKPDQLTVFPYPVGDQVLYPGTQNNLNFGIGLFNGYAYPIDLDQLKLYQVGTISSTEIDSLYAYADVDSNGLFEPGIDVRIGALGSTGASYVFENLGQTLGSAKVSYVFITYDIPLAVTDSATFDLRLFDTTDLAVWPFGTEIEGDFPINSPGIDVIDGMIAEQISTGHVPLYNASPNNKDILAMSFVVPANGIWTDWLEHITIENIGTATGGTDISELRLWKEAGGHPAKFDRGLEAPLAYLSWTGSSWRNTFSANEPIPASGLRVHITFSVAATPNDGATFQARLPLDGIQVRSSNDGPIDDVITNLTQQTISTDPLITSLLSDHSSYSTGQDITLSMITRNEGVDTLYGVHPSVITLSGNGAASILAGPVPASFDLLPGTDMTTVWTYSSDSAGDIQFCGSAYSADSSDVSIATCSEIIEIQNRAAGISVTLSNRTPSTVNRSQPDVDLFSVTLDFSAGDTLSAPLHLGGLTLILDDGSGAPVAANDLLTRIVFSDPAGTDHAFSVKDSTRSSLVLDTTEPIVVQPGKIFTLNLAGDISNSALLAPFRIGLLDLDNIRVTDANDGSPVPTNTADTFPWWTTSINVNTAAESLLVSSDSGKSVTANTGQENLHVFAIDLLNPGTPATAREIVTDFRIGFYDTTGTGISPTAVITRLRISVGSTTLFDGEPVGSTGNVMAANLTTPLVLSPEAPQTIDVYANVKNLPETPGFYMALDNPSAIVGRDMNTAALVAVAAANPAINDFPIVSDRVVFQLPANAVTVGFTDLLPPAVLPGFTSVPVMDIVVGHNDSGSASSVRIDSMTLQFVDPGGLPIYPGNAFVSLYIIHGSDTVATRTALSNSSPYAECGFKSPVTVAPGSSETLNVLVNIKPLYTPAAIEVRLEQTDLTVRDVNDGSRIFGISGQFPFVAGPVTLQLPSENARVALVSKIPPNISAKESNIEAFDLVFDNGDSEGHTAIELNALHVRIENSKGNVVDPALLTNGVRLIACDSTVVGGQFESDEIVFNLPAGLMVVPAESRDTLSILVDFETNLADQTFRFAIVGAASIEASDNITHTSVNATTENGGSFPLVTNWTHVLGNDIHASYTNYPNPFAAGREITAITYYLEQESSVTLKLYTIWGKPVATLLDNKAREPGLHQDVTWDGRNGDGDVVNNGVYYLVLEIRDENGSDTSIKRKVGVVR